MIARTSTADSFVEGELEGWKQSEEVSTVSWVLSPNACEHCRKIANDVGTVSLGSNFVNKGDKLGSRTYDYKDIKGPSAHTNCRCDLSPNLK